EVKAREERAKDTNRALIPPLFFSYPPAVVGALKKRKDLCGVHTRPGEGEVAFFPAYESE
ncbi:Hok/Gef family protein, partial [Escherichia coli]|uniref:Hok/Gef family protein n=1 Tax=Escherichia coli TaxID=562 RepID=UPI003D9B57DD